MYFELQQEQKHRKKAKKKDKDQTYTCLNDFSPISERLFSY